MDNIDDLKMELKILKKRIEILENSENKRKIKKNITVIIKICFFLLTIYVLYRGYTYVKENVPHLIEDKIKESININKIKVED